MRTLEGMNLRKREITALEQISTAVAARPMPMPLFSEVVVARVGHMPISCTSTGLLVKMPSYSCCRYFFIWHPPYCWVAA